MQRVCFWWSLTLPQVRTLIHFITLHHTASPLHHTASHSITLHHPCIKLHHTASPLHHTPSQCITLHHTASHCITLHIASHCITLHHTASPCITLHHPASPCITLHHPCITLHHPCITPASYGHCTAASLGLDDLSGISLASPLCATLLEFDTATGVRFYACSLFLGQTECVDVVVCARESDIMLAKLKPK